MGRRGCGTRKLLRAGIGGRPACPELTELEVESDLGRLLEVAALLGCTWGCKSRLGEALHGLYQAEDPPCIIGVAAMDSSPAREEARVSSRLAFSFPARKLPAGICSEG